MRLPFFNSPLMYYVRVYSYLFKLKGGRLIQISTVSISMKIIGMIDTHSGESILLIPLQCLVVLLHEMKTVQSTQAVFILYVRNIAI